MGFTFADYRETLRAYRDCGYAITGFLPFLTEPRERHLILRHDSDHTLEQAMRIAEIDAEVGCSATIFLRVHAVGYNLLAVKNLLRVQELIDMGHEVELHLDGNLAATLG